MAQIVAAAEGVRIIKVGKIIIWIDINLIIRWGCARCPNKGSWVEGIQRMLRLFWVERIFIFFFVWFCCLLVLRIFQILSEDLFLVQIKRSGLLSHFMYSFSLFNTLETAECTDNFLAKHLKSPWMANKLADFTPYASLVRRLILAKTLNEPFPRQYLFCLPVDETWPPFLAPDGVSLRRLLFWRGFFFTLPLDYSDSFRLRTSYTENFRFLL